jgi:PST family polysaccharide transporter
MMGNGDRLVLGMLQSKAVVGSYYFAFLLSAQTIATLTVNLATALFPALSSLKDDPVRLKAAYIRATRAINSLSAPACLLQAALAGPLLRLIYGQKWVTAIPSLRILSIGMAFSVLGGVQSSMILAQGRFKLFFHWSVMITIAYIAFIATGGKLGGAAAVATAVTLFYAVFGPLGFYLSVKPLGGGVSDVLRVCMVPIILGTAAMAPPVALASLLPQTRLGDAISLLFITAASGILYIAILRFFWPLEYLEIKTRLVSLRSRLAIGKG